MPDITAETVEKGEDYYHVRYRDPDEFDEIRTPDWAEAPAGSVVEGAAVRTGDEHANENWTVQSVLVPVDRVTDQNEAVTQSDRILEKLES